MSLISRFKPRGANGFGYGSTAEDVTHGVDLAGKTVLVTGCNSGLGLETMRVLALRGAHVLGTSRTREKAEAACRQAAGKATGLACELADPAAVRACVAEVRQLGVALDAIVANAGIMALPQLQTACGYELQFFTNHIGHFMLVTGLMDTLAEDGRVVMVSSAGHVAAPRAGISFDNLDGSKGYRPWVAYGQSKMANLLFAKELSRRFKASARTANACHPGVINTNLGRHMGAWMNAAMGKVTEALIMKSIPQGAATQCYLAANPAAATVSGAYFADCNPARARRDADDAVLAQRLWDRSEEIVAGLSAP